MYDGLVVGVLDKITMPSLLLCVFRMFLWCQPFRLFAFRPRTRESYYRNLKYEW